MPTVKDVAKRAGVSVATVSRVLNNSEKVSEQTRQKVLNAIEELGFKPNLLARNFRKDRSSLILVVLPTIANAYFARVVKGIEDTARKNGYGILLCTTQNSPEIAAEYLKLIERKQVDGAIIASAKIEIDFCKGLDTKRIVQACEFYPFLDTSLVTIDHKRAFYDIVDYLVKKGKKNILCAIGNEGIPSEFARKEGYKEALEENGLEFKEENVIRCSYGWTELYEKLRNLCCLKKYDAIACSSDLMAVGAIKAAKALGLKVPDEFSVTGFDNIMVSRIYEPSITTVAQPMYEIGEKAATILIDIIENQSVYVKQRIILPHELKTRESA
ncbi:transcriptional regulator, LacI family [Caldicellulosiruptor owensensis OL]|uniref:Transcriptional regulator, LacI family n=1 Tax=Caldicellulosiruptor owensensis (strain ATCC 700167 / DSM 13100 / OL) TaxID=632518 RepID=E4Q2S3_CALOW|nr:LacI family DNA-binding transcriptional regulator [Caldicellulosiruptor owensensis]ADQ03827.1 transcriptional regulator, LacI family [Caldicellulosiruptor owensensis OL]